MEVHSDRAGCRRRTARPRGCGTSNWPWACQAPGSKSASGGAELYPDWVLRERVTGTGWALVEYANCRYA
ncbi:MAG: hypothetical protein ABSH32_26955, partial [Bryobacteraceae bacterium]